MIKSWKFHKFSISGEWTLADFRHNLLEYRRPRRRSQSHTFLYVPGRDMSAVSFVISLAGEAGSGQVLNGNGK